MVKGMLSFIHRSSFIVHRFFLILFILSIPVNFISD